MLDNRIVSNSWLIAEAEQKVAVQAYRRARKSWKLVRIVNSTKEAPGAKMTTDAQILDDIQKTGTSPVHRASSTCIMAERDKTVAVLDTLGEVIGLEALPVLDSSSFRFTALGHTQGTSCD